LRNDGSDVRAIVSQPLDLMVALCNLVNKHPIRGPSAATQAGRRPRVVPSP
jgi:hypothetical protein